LEHSTPPDGLTGSAPPIRVSPAHLPPSGQQLIALLIEDPSVPSAEIGARLGIRVVASEPTAAAAWASCAATRRSRA
jgi:hypothetical protein